MALVAPLPLATTSSSVWGSAGFGGHPSRSPDPMTSIMAYHHQQHPYSLPPDPAAGYMAGSGLAHHHHSSSQASSSVGHHRADRASHGSMELKPPIHFIGHHHLDHDMMGDGSGERKRNKLGYQRTPMACVPCRKRKIRCIPTAGSDGACQQCVRLKKACFYTNVDGTPVEPPKPSLGAYSPSGLADAPSNGKAPGNPSDYTPLAIPTCMKTLLPAAMKTASDAPFSDPRIDKDSSPSRSYDYPPSMTNWMAAETTSSPVSAKASEMTASWKSYLQESPVTASAYPPHGQQPPPPAGTAPHHQPAWPQPNHPHHQQVGEPSQHGGSGMPWYPALPRSMAYPSEHYAAPPKSVPSNMYPAGAAPAVVAAATAGAAAAAAAGRQPSVMDPSIPLSPSPVAAPSDYWQHTPPPHPHPHHQQHQQYVYSKQGSTDSYGSWGYGEGSQAGSMALEDQGTPSAESQPDSAGIYFPVR